MPPAMQTSWQVQQLAGEPTATIRVQNLQSTIKGPQDAWGRPGRPQPILVSAEVSLEKPFASSSTTDAVESDTVHYGLLSKAILSHLEQTFNTGGPWTLHRVLDSIWKTLTGLDFHGNSSSTREAGPFLNTCLIRRLAISVKLPKASLLGDYAELSASAVFQNPAPAPELHVQARSTTLNIQGLRVPTLIGVNDNERQARQIVVANIGIEKLLDLGDAYTGLEAVVVKLLTESSCETLEALAAELAAVIVRYLEENQKLHPSSPGWQIRIGLEKPTAVPFADAPCIELRVDSRDASGGLRRTN